MDEFKIFEGVGGKRQNVKLPIIEGNEVKEPVFIQVDDAEDKGT